MSIHRGKHTLLNFINFVIPRKNLEPAYLNIKCASQQILFQNNIRIVDFAGKVFTNPEVSEYGWTMVHLLDESHLSFHAYTEPHIGKLAVDLFTCCSNPINHNTSLSSLTEFLINNYKCTLESSETIDRF